MAKKKRFLIEGDLPRWGHIEEWVWAYWPSDALKVVRLRFEKRYPDVVLPPLGPYLEAIESPPKKKVLSPV